MDIGVNIANFSSNSSAMPFLNLFKMGTGWWGTAGGTEYQQRQNAFDLDSNGYLQSMDGIGPAAGSTFTSANMNILVGIGPMEHGGTRGSPSYPEGDYVLLYDGTGTITFSAGYDSIVSTAAGRVVARVTGAPGTMTITQTATDPDDHLRNIRVIYIGSVSSPNGNEDAVAAGTIFNPDYISRIAVFKALRFMWWMVTYTNNNTSWSTRAKAPQVTWALGGDVSSTTPQGVPIEVQVALCNEVGADGWFNIPLLATEDYVSQFATLVHEGYTDSDGVVWEGLAPGLKAYVEYGNEMWAPQTMQLSYYNADGTQPYNANAGFNIGGTSALGWNAFPSCGTADFPDEGNMAWDGAWVYSQYRQVTFGNLWKSVWSGYGDGDRVIRVLAGNFGNVGQGANLLNFTADVFDAVDPDAFTGTARDNADAYAVAPYFSSDNAPTTGMTVAELFADLLVGGSVTGGGMPQTLGLIEDNAALVADHGDIPLVAYEGGQQLEDWSPGKTDWNAINLYLDANRDPSIGPIYTTLMNAMQDAGFTLFLHYNDVCASTKYGYWGLLEHISDISSPKYDAVLDFIAGGTQIILGDYVLDNGLAALDTLADKILLCNGQPTDYAAAVSLAVGNKSGTAGAIFGSPSSGSPTGRKVSLNAITDGTITTAGSVTWWAAVDSSGSNLFASGPVDTPRSVTVGNFSLGTFDITLLES